MNFTLALEIGVREIWAHKFRSFLSMLGIVLGVSSLVATLGLTAGMEKGSRAVLTTIGGLERIQVQQKAIETEDLDFWTLSPGRTYQDVVALRASAPLISHVSAELRHNIPMTNGTGDEAGVNVWGVLPDHLEINNHQIGHGRFLTDLDVEKANRVVVVGEDIARRFFPHLPVESVPGQVLLLNRIPYEVAGVFVRYERPEDRKRRERGLEVQKLRRWDPFRQRNETVLIPFTTMFYDFKSGRFPENTPENIPLEMLVFRVADLDWFQEAMDQARAALEITHRGVDDFEFDTREDWFTSMEASLRATRISGGLIATISLLVGGIGITNIMLASITQRIREIGIRRAIGARARDIFHQILIESVLIGLIGGVLGVVAGAALMEILIWLAPGENMPEMTAQSVILGVIFAFFAGLISGLYPAFKAAALDPINALRYE